MDSDGCSASNDEVSFAATFGAAAKQWKYLLRILVSSLLLERLQESVNLRQQRTPHERTRDFGHLFHAGTIGGESRNNVIRSLAISCLAAPSESWHPRGNSE